MDNHQTEATASSPTQRYVSFRSLLTVVVVVFGLSIVCSSMLIKEEVSKIQNQQFIVVDYKERLARIPIESDSDDIDTLVSNLDQQIDYLASQGVFVIDKSALLSAPSESFISLISESKDTSTGE